MGSEILLDVRALGSHGVLTYDPGFSSTASCASAITYLDGAPLISSNTLSNFLQILATNSSIFRIQYCIFQHFF